MSSDEHLVRDLDAEQEVLRSVWQRIAHRWWLPVGGLIVGAVVGVLLAIGGGDVFEARTLVYLGRPFTPGGGGQIQSLATNPETVEEVIRSEVALQQAADESGLRVGQLRGNVRSGATAPALVEIIVQAPAAGPGRAGRGLARHPGDLGGL